MVHKAFITGTRFRKRSWLRDPRAPAYAVERTNGSQPTLFPAPDRHHAGNSCAEFKRSRITALASGRPWWEDRNASTHIGCRSIRYLGGNLAVRRKMASWRNDVGMNLPPPSSRSRSARCSFRRRSNTFLLSPDAAKRQGEVVNLAFLLLGGRNRAMGFLNTYNERLEGRPLDIAVASTDGCYRVKGAIRRQAEVFQ